MSSVQARLHESTMTVFVLGLLAGLLFGAGLLISGMANPAKVLNFLDVLGQWDPSLALVMGGAVIVTVFGYPLVQKREQPLIYNEFKMPTSRSVDIPLVSGAVLFGLGWGIGGFCPGPAWTSLASLNPSSLVFVVCMLLGMWIGGKIKSRSAVGQSGGVVEASGR